MFGLEETFFQFSSIVFPDFRTRAFFEVLILGKSECRGVPWYSYFRQYGLAHLLVLSGSQMGAYLKVWSYPIRILVARPVFGAWGLWAGKLGLISLGFWYLSAVSFPAPLCRAWICAVFALFHPRLPLGNALGLGILAHVVLWSEHIHSRSMILSWGAYVFCRLSQVWVPHRTGQGLLSTILCQLWACWILGDWPKSLNSMISIIFFNWALVALFERLVFPLCGVFLSLVALSCLLGVATDEAAQSLYGLGQLMHTVFRGLLGVIESIGYILGYEP